MDINYSIRHALDEMDETVILTSHDLEFFRDACARVALVRERRIAWMVLRQMGLSKPGIQIEPWENRKDILMRIPDIRQST